MPATLSPLSSQRGTAGVYAFAWPRTAVSSGADEVRARAKEMIDRVERSRAGIGGKSDVISSLWMLAESHDQTGWDGGQALPANRSAIALAAAFIRALPNDCTMPHVAVDPDGAVALDWMVSRHRMLSISFAGDSDRLAYAWLDGTDRGNAVARFDRNTVPMRLVQAIQAMSDRVSDAALRAA